MQQFFRWLRWLAWSSTLLGGLVAFSWLAIHAMPFEIPFDDRVLAIATFWSLIVLTAYLAQL